jgi:hypothetical protein
MRLGCNDMAISPNISSGQMQKPSAGWFRGCNSMRNPWLLDDAMYQYGVNIVNRGGIIQTRPGKKVVLTLPKGNFQGYEVFTVTKTNSSGGPLASAGQYIVAAVDGKVYASKFPLTQPSDWESRRLKNISFSPSAKFVIFSPTEKSVSTTSGGEISIVSTYSVLIMQDGSSRACYWDGDVDAASDEGQAGIPIGLWMSYSGNRLWVMRDNIALASDLLDPISFKERLTGVSRGDYKFPDEITGCANTIGENQQANLVIFTANSTYKLLSFIQDRDDWSTTVNFQTTLFPSLGCIAGNSIINHSGLLWWYSYGGLVSSDSATTAFLTSRIRYRDVEMARAKLGLSEDLSRICCCSFESYLLVAVPSGGGQALGEGLNTQTMVIDYSIADEQLQDEPPAWQGVWTGTRPVKFVTAEVSGVRKCFEGSVDYQSLNGSFNHIWENFKPERTDQYDVEDTQGNVTTVHNPIYCSFETKLYGDGLDLKIFKYAVVNLIEIADKVHFKCSYRGTRGGYKDILNVNILAPVHAYSDPRIQAYLDQGVVLVPQSRRLYSEVAQPPEEEENDLGYLESDYNETIDTYFSLYMQWCGRLGVESLILTMELQPERPTGRCTPDETLVGIVTQDGRSIILS